MHDQVTMNYYRKHFLYSLLETSEINSKAAASRSFQSTSESLLDISFLYKRLLCSAYKGLTVNVKILCGWASRTKLEDGFVWTRNTQTQLLLVVAFVLTIKTSKEEIKNQLP